MDRGTLSDKRVAAVLEKGNCIRLRAYVDKEPELARNYRVPNPDLRDEQGYAPFPSLQLWTPSGVMVARLDAMSPPEKFIPWLEKALARWPAIAKKEQELIKKLASNPRRSAAYKTLAHFYAKHETYRKAAETWAAFVRLKSEKKDPKVYQAALQAGHNHMQYGGYTEALDILAVAAEKGAPSRETALYFMAFSEKYMGRGDKARPHYQALLKEFPKSRWAAEAKKALKRRKKKFY